LFATERPRGDGSGLDVLDVLDGEFEEASGECALSGDDAGYVRGVRAARVVEE
jgi:hypothetical protein